MSLKRVEIKVIGLVRGVFFRQGVRAEAGRLGITGWVRNEDDGSVRITVEGTEADLQKLVKWCRKGTEWARVDKVEAEWQESGGEFKDFEIR